MSTRNEEMVLEHYFTNNQNLRSQIRDINFTYGSYNFVFKSDNGVFSKNKIDYASLFLVKTFLSYHKGNITNILDVGCGYGFIGITLSKVLNVHVDMLDINKRAVHLCNMNISENKVDASAVVSNVYENIHNTYDVVITNPPIRAGKDTVLEFLVGGLKLLNKDGELWYVIAKDQGAKSIMKKLNEVCNCEVIDKSKGFWVILAKN